MHSCLSFTHSGNGHVKPVFCCKYWPDRRRHERTYALVVLPVCRRMHIAPENLMPLCSKTQQKGTTWIELWAKHKGI